MSFATYKLTNNPNIPAEVTVDGRRTPVWIQQNWTDGENSLYIRRNGCGHCCTAMVLNLRGIKITPYDEYMHCRKLWGVPNEAANPPQDHFITVSGITKVLESFGIKSECFGVAKGEEEKAAADIVAALEDGKLVIIESHPSEDFPDNPFSDGEHYVLAVGIFEDGRVLIANSSGRAEPTGFQLVDSETIAKALYPDTVPDKSMTWGIVEKIPNGVGYVIVD